MNSHRDPLHLLPEPRPMSGPRCTKCDAVDFNRTRLADHYVCSGCYWLHGCTQCHQHFATPADENGWCLQCYAGFLSRHPEEYTQRRAALMQSEEGRRVVAMVDERRREVA